PLAHAQRKGKQSASQTANDNTATPKTGTTKRVFVGGSSSTPQGSRVTIKSDNPLNDYSAYRSGDRFYVVVPGANAGSVAKGASGRGFSDMQVQQRGKDVVLSYRVQPGAKPKVEQKFNRLDVVFETPEGATAAAQDNSRNARTPANANQNPATNSQASNQTSTPAANQAATDRNAGRTNAAGTSPAQTSSTASTTGGSAQPAGVVEPSTPQASLPPLAEQTPAPTPAETQPAAEQQLAQAQPPTTTAPITTTTTTTQPSATAGTSIGAVVLRNWPLALVLTLLVVGVGLFFAARRSSATEPAAPQTPEAGAKLKDTRAAKLKDASSSLSAVETKQAAETSAVNAAVVTPVMSKPAASGTAKQKKEEKKKKHKERAEEARPVVAQDAGAVASTEAAISSTETTAAAEPTATVAPEVALASSLAALSPTVAESSEAKPSEEKESSAAIVAKDIEPAVSLDGDVVQVETKRLLDGEPFDERVVGTSDVLARQMIGAELLAALAGRNPERRARAHAVFVKHGYYDEAVKDLGGASAPAERASAARSLGLTGERTATPQLIAALEDSSVEVRRAAVEALASLRDPSAVEPLEALLEREKKSKTKVNRKLVQHAVETCREGSAEPPALATVAAPVAEITTEAESVTAPVVEETASVIEEIAPAPATETAPELLVTEDASVETVAPEITVEELAAAETTVESPSVEVPATEPAASVEEVVAESALAEETAIEPAPVEEATRELVAVEDELTVSVEDEWAVEEPAVVEETAAPEESPVKDLELQEDEAETPTVEAAPVETAATTVVSEEYAAAGPQAFEEAPHAVEAEEFTLTPPPSEVAPALEDESFEPVAEARELEPFRETEPSLPFADTSGEAESLPSEVEYVEAPAVEPAAVEGSALTVEHEPSEVRDIEALEESPARFVGETALEPLRDADSSDWIELDMSEAAAPASESPAPVFETSGGGTLSETVAAPSALAETETRLEEQPAATQAASAPQEIETGFADEHVAAPAAPSATVGGE
ncbi:MAG TPA: HEAT repeat domain-containing protein, partial [Pyrinomonadaceae bacterium]|nr:HEAT repeat domain-containing protein [Pyrinomonadaceae bacterium]